MQRAQSWGNARHGAEYEASVVNWGILARTVCSDASQQPLSLGIRMFLSSIRGFYDLLQERRWGEVRVTFLLLPLFSNSCSL